MKLRPLADRVLVLPDPPEKNFGNIIIPESSQEAPSSGVVIATGNGRVDEPMEVKSGDKVWYPKLRGNTVLIDGIEHILIQQSELTAIVE